MPDLPASQWSVDQLKIAFERLTEENKLLKRKLDLVMDHLKVRYDESPRLVERHVFGGYAGNMGDDTNQPKP